MAVRCIVRVLRPQANVVGASGAVYTILGAWTAHITQNWDTMNPITRWPQAIGIFLLTGLDLGNQIYKRYNSGIGTLASLISIYMCLLLLCVANCHDCRR